MNTACKQGQADNPHVGCLSGALALLYSLKTITSGFKEVLKKTVKSRQRSSGHSDFCDNRRIKWGQNVFEPLPLMLPTGDQKNVADKFNCKKNSVTLYIFLQEKHTLNYK